MIVTNKGIDVSYYDALLNWREYDWNFAYIKVSEGIYPDVVFSRQWAGARGFTYRGAYHFFRVITPPRDAVAKMLDLMNGDLGELPVALDLEDADGASYQQFNERAIEWIEEFRRQAKALPIIYSSTSFIQAMKMNLYPYYRDYKLWLAQYPYDNYAIDNRKQVIQATLDQMINLRIPATPDPFLRLAFIQWTGKGMPEVVPGYLQQNKLAVDFNAYNGTVDEMKQEFRLSELPDNGGGEMPDTVLYYADLKANSQSNVRVAADLQSGLVQLITGPLTVSIVSEAVQNDGYTWYKIAVPVSGYIAYTSSYTNLRPAESIPPEPPTGNKPVSVTINLDGYKPLTLSGEMEPE